MLGVTKLQRGLIVVESKVETDSPVQLAKQLYGFRIISIILLKYFNEMAMLA